MTVPMGFASPKDGITQLPGSLQFLARPFDEANMIRAAFAYEQATRHRRSAPSFHLPTIIPSFLLCWGSFAPA